MFDVFINYRTADVKYGAAATYELLADRFGRKRIFLDNQSIRPGMEYPARLRAALESMRVLLVLIGPDWLDSRLSNGSLMIEQDGDWVRREIRRGLERSVLIVPVLLDGAVLPDPARLPGDIRSLVRRQAVAIRHNHLRGDVTVLGDRLVELVPTPAMSQAGVSEDRAFRLPQPTVPRQLPSAIRTFVGRADYLAELDTVLGADQAVDTDAVSIVVVDGAAGIGKTNLVVTWAHRGERCFPDGTLCADLCGYGPGVPLDPSLVLVSFLRALGVPARKVPNDLTAQVGMYRSLLADRRVLVLDNAVDAEQVRPLLPGAASCRVLVTSRTALTGLVVAEGAHRVVLELFTSREAEELVRAVIGAERMADEPTAVGELVQLCGRLPLALRVAAARVANHRHLAVADVVRELTQAPDRVDVLSRTGDPHTAVRTVFDWSLAGLPPELGRLFSRFGVQPALEFGVHAAAALFEMNVSAARRRLEQLTEVHLVESIARERYQIHELLHAYATDRVAMDVFVEERRDALMAILDWYASTATAADRLMFPTHPALEVALAPVSVPAPFNDRAGAWSWLSEERPTLVAMLRLAEDHALHRITIALSAAMRFLALMPRVLWHDRLDAETRGLTAAAAIGDRTTEAAFLRRRADTHQMLGNWAASDVDLERGITLAIEDGDDVLRGHALCGLGRNRKLQHRYAEAMTYYQRALPLVCATGTRYVEAVVEANLSQLSWRLGRHHDALRHAERELMLHRDAGDAVGEAYAMHDLAMARGELGDHAAAVSLSGCAVATFRSTAGTEGYLAATLETMAKSLAHLGDLSRATTCLDEATAILERTGEPHAEALRHRATLLRSPASPQPSR